MKKPMLPVFFAILLASLVMCLLPMGCQNTQQGSNMPTDTIVDSTYLTTASIDSCPDVRYDTIKPATIEKVHTQKITQTAAAVDKINTDSLIHSTPKEKADIRVKPPEVKDTIAVSLQDQFNLLTNDALDSKEKRNILRHIQDMFTDDTDESRVKGTFVGQPQPSYSISEYVRRLKMTNSYKVHIKNIRTDPTGKVSFVEVQEIEENSATSAPKIEKTSGNAID